MSGHAPRSGAHAPSAFSAYRILLAKDLRLELRTHDMLGSMGLYSVLVLIVFGVVFSQVGSAVDVSNLAGGLVWVLVVFTSLLGLGRSFAHEKEQGSIDGVLLAPIDRSIIYLAKLTSNLVFLGAVELVALPLFYFFFLTTVEPSTTFWFSVLPVVLGTVGISAVGTLLATITAGARGRDVLLAVLLIPVLFPLLYGCVAATTAALTCPADWLETFRLGIVFAGAYDIIMVLASWVLYEHLLSA